MSVINIIYFILFGGCYPDRRPIADPTTAGEEYARWSLSDCEGNLERVAVERNIMRWFRTI
jgi:hypothetical protein